MDALKSVGKAILRSPSIARHTRRVTGHHKLPESWPESQDALLEGVIFYLKYLGMTLVEKPKGEDMAAAAIRRIITMARASAEKFKKVIVTVTPHGIDIKEAAGGQRIEYVSIYRISYCTTDKVQNKVFAYVAQNQSNGALECHAFLSPKKKLAQTVTLTVAQAFTVALELWQASREGKDDSSLRLSQNPESVVQQPDPCARIPGTHSSYAGVGDQISSTDLPSRTLRHGEEEEDEEYDELDEAFTRLQDTYVLAIIISCVDWVISNPLRTERWSSFMCYVPMVAACFIYREASTQLDSMRDLVSPPVKKQV